MFEDMTNRTGLTCRKIAINGFVDFNGNTEKHAWSEVLINESEWVVADSGFNYSPPADNYFDYSKIWLLGPVYAFEYGVQKEDRTTYYIPNTEEMIIKLKNTPYVSKEKERPLLKIAEGYGDMKIW